MTDPMTTTRDGDVLTTQDLVDKVKHLGYALQHGGGGVVLPDLEDIVRSHRALQQRLDAAERRAEEAIEGLQFFAAGSAYITNIAPRWERDYWRLHVAPHAIERLHDLDVPALTEQERD